jgi:hypothetical protein
MPGNSRSPPRQIRAFPPTTPIPARRDWRTLSKVINASSTGKPASSQRVNFASNTGHTLFAFSTTFEGLDGVSIFIENARILGYGRPRAD